MSEFTINIAAGEQKRLLTGGKYCEDDIVVSASGGSHPAVSPKQVNFYDYDGTCLYSYTVEEAAALTELPALPEHDGLVCQGWNWTLDDIKAANRPVNAGAMYTTDDGKTRIYITLADGRTSPMLGCRLNGTLTVDWGDGTEPDILTGTDITEVQWTPNHEYAAAGDYVISLTVDGEMGFYGLDSTNAYSAALRYTEASDVRNRIYQNSIRKIEIGMGVTSIGAAGVYNCSLLETITIPLEVSSIGDSAFYNCYMLKSITLPRSLTAVGTYSFYNCYSLRTAVLPSGVTEIGARAFRGCSQLESITIPDGVSTLGSYLLYGCYSLGFVSLPDGITSIENYAFQSCHSLPSVTIPDGVTSIGTYVFQNGYALTSLVIPGQVASIGNSAFSGCGGVKVYDFTGHTAVPSAGTSIFMSIASDCEIRVPAALADEWKAATNWAKYADYIVGVET